MAKSKFFTGKLYQRMSEDLHLAGMGQRTHDGYLRAVRQCVGSSGRAKIGPGFVAGVALCDQRCGSNESQRLRFPANSAGLGKRFPSEAVTIIQTDFLNQVLELRLASSRSQRLTCFRPHVAIGHAPIVGAIQ